MKETSTTIQDLGYTPEQVQAINRQCAAAQIQGMERLVEIQRQPVGVVLGFTATFPIAKAVQSDKEI